MDINSEPEPQVLDHLTQQMKIFPEIANAIAYRLAASKLWQLYNQTSEAINSKDFSRLPELHALACSLKVCTSYEVSAGVEKLRQACGGHGFLNASNLGSLFNNLTAACTYEGENSVLYLQVGKILIKSWSSLQNGQKLMPTLSYLQQWKHDNKFVEWNGKWQCLVQALQYAAAK